MAPQNAYETTVQVDPYRAPENPEVRGTNIIIFDGANPPRSFDLRVFFKNVVTFGRSPDNDIVLTSKYVSKHHGQFELNGNNIFVCDLDSKNGTLKNGTYVRHDSTSDEIVDDHACVRYCFCRSQRNITPQRQKRQMMFFRLQRYSLLSVRIFPCKQSLYVCPFDTVHV